MIDRRLPLLIFLVACAYTDAPEGPRRPLAGHSFLTIVGSDDVLVPGGVRHTLTVRYHDDEDHPLSGTVSFAPGEYFQTVSVPVNGDTAFEPDETFLVNLSNANGATIGTGQAISLWPVMGGSSQTLAGSEVGDRPVGWSADGRLLWIFRRGEVPAPVFRLDIASPSGSRTVGQPTTSMSKFRSDTIFRITINCW